MFFVVQANSEFAEQNKDSKLFTVSLSDILWVPSFFPTQDTEHKQELERAWPHISRQCWFDIVGTNLC